MLEVFNTLRYEPAFYEAILKSDYGNTTKRDQESSPAQA